MCIRTSHSSVFSHKLFSQLKQYLYWYINIMVIRFGNILLALIIPLK